MIYKILIINGCCSIILAGLIVAYQTKSFGLASANICVGIANLIFMLK